MICRVCLEKEGTIYLDARNNTTVKPACQDCYESIIRNSKSLGGYRPGYIGPGKDRDHDKMDQEHVDALDWWEKQCGKH